MSPFLPMASTEGSGPLAVVWGGEDPPGPRRTPAGRRAAGVTAGSFLFKSGSTWGGIVKPPTRLPLTLAHVRLQCACSVHTVLAESEPTP